MKRTLALLLAAVLCVSLAACGSKTQDSQSSSENLPDDTGGEETSPVYARNKDGIIELTPEQFDGFCKIVELTTDNWNAYFGSRAIYNQIWLDSLEDVTVIGVRGVALSFSDVIDNQVEKVDITAEASYSRFSYCDYDYSEAVCTAAVGKILIAEIPDELWTENNDGRLVIQVGAGEPFFL